MTMSAKTVSAKTVSAKAERDGESADDIGLFGRLVRGHRDRIGLTQRELADLSTISVRAIRDLEQGRATRPRHATVRLIADGLRLGPRARADLEAAARQGRYGWALKAGYDATPMVPPAALDVLMGRESEAAALTAELASGTERLVNVMGLSGVGKTRLALEVAARLHSGSGFPVLWAAFAGPPVAYRQQSGPEGLAALVAGCADALFGRPVARPPPRAPPTGRTGTPMSRRSPNSWRTGPRCWWWTARSPTARTPPSSTGCCATARSSGSW